MRGRVLVVLAFVLSAGLFASAAVALVVASRDSGTVAPSALPTAFPTLGLPSATPTPTPTPVFTVTPLPTPSRTASSTPSPTASPTASPAARATTRAPKPSPTRTVQAAGLVATAGVDKATGAKTGDVITLTAHATDGDGEIRLQSLSWGDGGLGPTGDRGTSCSPAAKAPADCRDFRWTHTFTTPGTYTITVWLTSGLEKTRLQLPVTIS